MNKEQIQRIKYLIDNFDNKTQLIIAMEELSELIKETSKFLRGIGNKEELIGEVADVMIMVKQIEFILKIDDNELSNKIDKKLDRTFTRLGIK